jgi:DNA-binding transcriptional ArsR family regulator
VIKLINKIKYNIILDLIFSITRILETDTFNKHDLFKRFKLNKDIEEYINDVKATINPILKKDIEYTCSKFYLGLFSIAFNADDKGIDNIPDFLDSIRKMSGDTFIKAIINKLELNVPNNIDKLELEKIFKHEIQNELDLLNYDNIDIYMDYFKYPDAMKERLVNTLTDYYYSYFESIEQKIKTFINQKLQDHQHLFDKDHNKFIENIVLMSDKNKLKKKNTKFYISYFSELGSGIWVNDNTYTIFYGYSLEQRFDDNMKILEYKELIKIISDENRFNIIKLLGERSWYGKELADYFGITTATMSYHLKKISTLGIIDIEPGKNKRLYYKLNKDKFKKIINFMVDDIVSPHENN